MFGDFRFNIFGNFRISLGLAVLDTNGCWLWPANDRNCVNMKFIIKINRFGSFSWGNGGHILFICEVVGEDELLGISFSVYKVLVTRNCVLYRWKCFNYLWSALGNFKKRAGDWNVVSKFLNYCVMNVVFKI